MSGLLQNRMPDRFLLASFILHFCLGLFFFFVSRWHLAVSKGPEGLSSSHVSYIRRSVRVDVVKMPTITLEELKKRVHVQPMTPSFDTPVPEKKTISSLGSLLSSWEKKEIGINLKKKKIEAQRRKGVIKKSGQSGSSLKQHLVDDLIYSGNKVLEGSALVGERNVEGEDSPFALYVGEVIDTIRPHWVLPSSLMEQSLKARIQIYLNQEGKLLSLKLLESSGVSLFDQQAISSIRAVELFPLPEGSLYQTLLKRGIVLGFPL